MVKACELTGLELVPAQVFWPALFARKGRGAFFGRAEHGTRRCSESVLGLLTGWFWVAWRRFRLRKKFRGAHRPATTLAAHAA